MSLHRSTFDIVCNRFIFVCLTIHNAIINLKSTPKNFLLSLSLNFVLWILLIGMFYYNVSVVWEWNLFIHLRTHHHHLQSDFLTRRRIQEWYNTIIMKSPGPCWEFQWNSLTVSSTIINRSKWIHCCHSPKKTHYQIFFLQVRRTTV